MSIADKLTTIAENMQEVHKAGILNERERFWNIYQDYGKRTNYSNAFYMYTEDIFHPLYDINCVGTAQDIFSQWKTKCDMVELLGRLGKKFITSGITNYTQAFSSAMFTRIGTIDCSNVTAPNGMYGIFATWGEPVLEQIDSIKVSETTPFNFCFYRQSKLKEIRFEGVIGQNGFNVQWSTLLSRESILGKEATEEQIETGANLVFLNDKYYYGGIFGALSNETSGLTITLSKTAVNNAFETAEGAADGSTSEEWAALIATKQTWTISLV